MKNATDFYYEAEVEWKQGRLGELKSKGLPSLAVAPPREFEGPGDRWTPEQLSVASITSCFMITFLAIAGNSKLELVSFRVSGRGKLEKVEGVGYQISEVVLKPTLVIRSVADLDRAGRILEKAKKSCLITNSVKSLIKLEPELYHQASQTIPCPPVG
jgi:organic hydroperoxide reductase OsmC/OhrA